MRPVALILVVVAVLAAGLTAFLAKRWVDSQAAPPAPVAAPIGTEVLVAARDLPAGATLAEGDLRYELWPTGPAAERFTTRKAGDEARTAFVGQITRRPLAEGEPLVPAATFKPGDAGLLAGMLSPGMRAVSVAITNASAVSGFVVPGDRVDVVLAADFQRADAEITKGRGGAIVRYAAETVLEDVKVLAIDQQIAKDKDGASIQGKTATLEVSAKQSERLHAAAMLGQLSLVLRGIVLPAEPEPAPKLPYTADTEASQAMRALNAPKPRAGGGGIRINRGGDVTTKSF